MDKFLSMDIIYFDELTTDEKERIRRRITRVSPTYQVYIPRSVARIGNLQPEQYVYVTYDEKNKWFIVKPVKIVLEAENKNL